MWQLLDNGRLVLRLIQDPRVPALIKVGIPLLVALYFISPIDFIPDFLLGPGQLDDLGIVLLGMTLLVRLAPRDVVDEHRRALGMESGASGNPGGYQAPPTGPEPQSGGAPIDAEYRVIPPDQAQDNNTRKL